MTQRISQRGYFVVALTRSSNGRKEKAVKQVHRLVLEAFVGPCPPGMEGCHGPGGKLDNRASELRWATPSENNGVDKARDGKSNRGERCAMAKLTAEIVTRIRIRYAAGEDQVTLAREYGVHRRTISSVVNGRSWAHLPSPVGEVRPPERGSRGESHPGAKLTQAVVEDCRRRYVAGETQTALAREYGVSLSTVHLVVHGRIWKPAA